MTHHYASVARYHQLRQAGMKVNNRLVKSLPRSLIEQGAKNLGISKKNRIELDTEDEVAVLMDYCIHDLRQQNVNAVERLLKDSPPKPESDEFVLMHALGKARYSLFAVEAIEPGVGVELRDLLRDENQFIVDIGFSRSAQIGLVMALRVMTPEGIGMTTGTGLPVGVLSEVDRSKLVQEMLSIVPGHDIHQLTAEQTSVLNGRIIRTCLEGGAAKRIHYADPEPASQLVNRSAPTAPPRTHIGRNSPCPCGSGKKFKVCCGARR
ncbi:MAG TPA: SEC-C metal-binding domain-containing protein [Gemmataceae bacterium]|jgi:hypothetical protein|nr:SEC-C metal-binding domain-containing protein [Gemmataceae bacterium]